MALLDRRIGRSPSLWLIPEGDEALVFDSLLTTLREEHGGPSFTPHLTLLSGLNATNLVDRTRQLAKQVAPFEVRIAQPSWGSRWFQCVYLLAELAPPLLAARRAACVALMGSPTSSFLPHISLLYGSQPARTRAEICRSLPNVPSGFQARELVLVNTIGPTDSWTEMGRFPLTGAA
jgi:2'-5' RNA ligase